MKALSRILLLALVLPISFGCANVADRMVSGAERGAERAVDREASRQADNAVTSVMRTAENAVICLVTDIECIENARRDGDAVEVRDQNGNVVNTYPAPDGNVNVNPDFAGGQRTIFYTDYSNDPIGNFPSSLEFVSGNWEVAEWQGRRLLRNTGPRGAAIRIVLPETLPENFTIETEIYFPQVNQQFVLLTQPPAGRWQQVDYNYFQLAGAQGTGVEANSGLGLSTSVNEDRSVHDSLVPIRISVEGEYVKTYVGSNRTANMPNAHLPRSEALHLENIYAASEEEPMYLGPIRIAAL